MNIFKQILVFCNMADVDIETARNAGIKCISASWGFRDKDYLESLNPGAVIDIPHELYNHLL